MSTIFEYGKELHALCRENQYSKAVWLFEHVISESLPERQIFQSFLVMWKVPEAYCKTNQWAKGISLAFHYLTPLSKLKVNVDHIYKSFGFLILKALWHDPPLVKPQSIDPGKIYQLLKILKNNPANYDIGKKLYIRWVKLIPTIPTFNFFTGQLFYQLYQPNELACNLSNNNSLQAFTMLDIWYLNYSKFLYNHKHFEQCVSLCENALDSKAQLSQACRIWVTRRYALALKQLGNTGKAITLLEVLAKRKSEWYIYRELAELYFQKNDTANGKKCLFTAYRLGGHNPGKTTLYEQIGDFCTDQDMPAMAQQFYLLALSVRREQQWYIPDSLKNKVSGNSTIPNSAQHYRNMLRVFQPVTEKNDMVFGEGKITRILHPGLNGDGFITDTEGNSVYFRFSQANFDAYDAADGYPVKFKAKFTFHNGQKRLKAIKVYSNQ